MIGIVGRSAPEVAAFDLSLAMDCYPLRDAYRLGHRESNRYPPKLGLAGPSFSGSDLIIHMLMNDPENLQPHGFSRVWVNKRHQQIDGLFDAGRQIGAWIGQITSMSVEVFGQFLVQVGK